MEIFQKPVTVRQAAEGGFEVFIGLLIGTSVAHYTVLTPLGEYNGQKVRFWNRIAAYMVFRLLSSADDTHDLLLYMGPQNVLQS